jgi:gas vesicle protein
MDCAFCGEPTGKGIHKTERMTIMKSGDVIIGTMIGTAVGIAVGMLFAPEKGSVTRKNISQMSSAYADTLKGKIDSYADTMNKKIDTVQDKAIDWLERRKEKMQMHTAESMRGNNN